MDVFPSNAVETLSCHVEAKWPQSLFAQQPFEMTVDSDTDTELLEHPWEFDDSSLDIVQKCATKGLML